MSYKVIPTCIKWNSFSLALNNGHKILLAAAVGLMLNSHWDRCLCLALGEYIYCLPCCHISAFSAFNSLFFYFLFFFLVSVYLCFWSCFDFIFSSLWVFSDWFGTLSRFHLICVFARTQNAWLVPFSSAWPCGVCVIYGKWNPALKSTI